MTEAQAYAAASKRVYRSILEAKGYTTVGYALNDCVSALNGWATIHYGCGKSEAVQIVDAMIKTEMAMGAKPSGLTVEQLVMLDEYCKKLAKIPIVPGGTVVLPDLDLSGAQIVDDEPEK